MQKIKVLMVAVTFLIAGAITIPAASAQTILPPNGTRLPRNTRGRVRFINPYATPKPRTTRTTTKTRAPKVSARKKGESLNEMLEKVELSGGQRTKIQAIEAKANADGKAVSDDKTAVGDAAAQKLSDIDGAMVRDVENVLTPAQRKKLDAERAANAKRMGSTGSRLSGPPPASK